MKAASVRILEAIEAHSDASVVMRAHVRRILDLLDQFEAQVEATRPGVD